MSVSWDMVWEGKALDQGAGAEEFKTGCLVTHHYQSLMTGSRIQCKDLAPECKSFSSLSLQVSSADIFFIARPSCRRMQCVAACLVYTPYFIVAWHFEKHWLKMKVFPQTALSKGWKFSRPDALRIQES